MTKDEFQRMKKEFLKIKAEDWNDFVRKYPGVYMSDFDEDMKAHFNAMRRALVTEPRDPNVHYDIFKH